MYLTGFDCMLDLFLGPVTPNRINNGNILYEIAVDQNARFSPRVRSVISSVVIPVIDDPRSSLMASYPRVSFAGLSAGTLSIGVQSYSNSTSVLGRRPAASRILTGMVTCPFEGMRMNNTSKTRNILKVLLILDQIWPLLVMGGRAVGLDPRIHPLTISHE